MKSIVVFVMLVLGVLSFGQTSPVKFNKTVADFGEVTHGNTVLTTFSFVNTSDSSIKIKEVLPQCGCTSVDFTKDAVLPDAKGEIILKFNTNGKSGLERKTVTVIFSDDTQQVLVLKVNVVK